MAKDDTADTRLYTISQSMDPLSHWGRKMTTMFFEYLGCTATQICLSGFWDRFISLNQTPLNKTDKSNFVYPEKDSHMV
jgi:hypothetical protein